MTRKIAIVDDLKINGTIHARCESQQGNGMKNKQKILSLSVFFSFDPYHNVFPSVDKNEEKLKFDRVLKFLIYWDVLQN